MFYQLSSVHQTALLAAMFLTMLAAVFLICVSATGGESRPKTAVNVILFVALFVMAETFCDETEIRGVGLPVPAWILWSITAGAAVWLAAGIIGWRRRMRGSISLFSIKRAMDAVPAAVCFFAPSGEIKLCNPKMYSLYRDIAQRDLQSLSELDEALERCCGQAGVLRDSADDSTFIFPNGSVWHYSRSIIKAGGQDFTEVLFTEITELYEKRQELKRQSAELKEVYSDIKRLSENVLEMTREQEILTAKTRLHDHMGVGIAAVRQILLQNRTTEDNASALELWRKAISVIKSDNEYPEGSRDTADIIHDAAAVGISVEITGEIPTEGRTGGLALLAVRECLSNAANHAKATVLRICSEKTAGGVTLCISNDGKPAEEGAAPRGGLKNLSGKLSECGGSMEIRTIPEFVLTVTIPADLEDSV